MPWAMNVPRAYVEGQLDDVDPVKPIPGTVLISISSTGSVPVKHDPGFDAVLACWFDDIEPHHGDDWHGYTIMSSKDARRMAQFIKAHEGKNFLVHCDAGLSRSGAVVEVILELYPKYLDMGWGRFPNGHVKSLLKRALDMVPLGVASSPLVNEGRPFENQKTGEGEGAPEAHKPTGEESSGGPQEGGVS